METTPFSAHVVTDQAEGIGDPEIIVMTEDTGTGADPLAYIAYQADWVQALDDAGWSITGTPPNPTDHGGYFIVDVRPRDWELIIKTATFDRGVAEIEAKRTEDAWRFLIRAAVLAEESPTKIAAVADVSRERVYQIRDGRR
jgi:hypothetical protein